MLCVSLYVLLSFSFHHYIVCVSFIYGFLIIPLNCLCKLRQVLLFTFLIYFCLIFRPVCIMWSVVFGFNSMTFIRGYYLVLILRKATKRVRMEFNEPD
jgi:hypothetical protein